MTFSLPPGAAETIVRKRAMYCRLSDTNDLSQMDKIVLPDIDFVTVDKENKVLSLGATEAKFSTRAELVAYYGALFTAVNTLHVAGYPELELVAPDEIKAIFGATILIGSKKDEGAPLSTGGGYWYDTWKLKDGDWFLQKSKFVTLLWKDAPQ
ncbi:hypothetical protein ACHAQJ_005038 [Trichoderma viride]